MADRDTVLQIEATLDISSITSGMAEVQATVSNAVDSMRTKMEELSASGPKVSESITGQAAATRDLTDATSAQTTETDSASASTEDLSPAVEQLTFNFEQLGEEADDTNDKLDATAGAAEGVAAGMTKASAAAAKYKTNLEDVGNASDKATAASRKWSDEVNAAAEAAVKERTDQLIEAKTILAQKIEYLTERYNELKNTAGPADDRTKVASDLLDDAKKKLVTTQSQLTAAEILGVQETDRMRAAQVLAAKASHEAAEAKMKARQSAMLLGHEVGVALPKNIVRFISSLGPVAVALASAFTGVMIFGLIETLAEKLPAALNNGMQKLIMFASGVHQTKEEMEKANAETRSFINKMNELRAQTASAGRSAEVGTAMKIGVQADELNKIYQEAERVRGKFEKMNAEIKKYGGETHGWFMDLTEALGAAVLGDMQASGQLAGRAFFGPTKEEMEKTRGDMKKMMEERMAAEERMKLAFAEVHAKRVEQSHALQLAEQETTLATSRSQIEAAKNVTDQQERLGKISQIQAIAQRRETATQEFAIATQQIELKKKLLAEEDRLNSEVLAKGIAIQRKELEEFKRLHKDRVTEAQNREKAIAEQETNALNSSKEKHLALDRELVAATQKRNSELIAAETSRIEAQKSLEMERISTATQINNAMLEIERKRIAQQVALSQISTLQSMPLERGVAEKEHERKITDIGERKAVLTSKGATEATSPELRALITEEKTEMLNWQAQKIEMETREAVERKRIFQQSVADRLDAIRITTDAEISMEEQATSQLREARVISAEQQTSKLEELSNRRYKEEWNAQLQRIEQAKREPNTTTEAMSKMYAELVAMAKKHQVDISAIRNQGLMARIAEVEEEGSLATEYARQEMDAARSAADYRLQYAEIGMSQWAAESQTALDDWYSAEREALERSKQAYVEASMTKTADYQRLLMKMRDLDLQYGREQRAIQEQQLAGYRQMIGQITGAYMSGVNSWIQGQKTFKQAMIDGWNGMVMAIIQKIEQMALKWFTEHVIMTTVKRMFVTQNQVLDQTQAAASMAKKGMETSTFISAEQAKRAAKMMGATQDTMLDQVQLVSYGATKATETGIAVTSEAAKTTAKATGVAADVSLTATGETQKRAIQAPGILRAAKQAAVHVFKSVMEALPFPANVIVAPIAAAGAFAAALAFGGFEKGGIVKQDMIAQVHKDEMVLPAGISTALRAVLAESGGGGGGMSRMESTTTRHYESGYAMGGVVPADTVAMVHRNEIVIPEAVSNRLRTVISGFEKGGIVGGDTLASVHKNEMVLPSQISLGLQQLIKGPANVSGSTPTVHLHSSPTFIGNEAWMKENLRKQEAEINRMIKQSMRKNALPSAPW